MPEDSFSSQNRITDIETRSGRFLTESLVKRMVARDVELMDLAERGGPPSSTPAISAIQKQGDLTYTQNATIGGLVYCDTFTINPGVTVIVDRFLVLVCRGEVTIHGWLNADGAGQAGGVMGTPGTDGLDGLTAGGGGGRADTSAIGGKGGNGAFGLLGGVGGVGDAGRHGGVGAEHTAMSKALVLSGAMQWLLGGAGGGGGGDSGGDGTGGRGGGVIIIEAGSVNITSNGKISADGQAGAWGGTSNGGGGGGGGGLISVRCKNWSQTGALSVAGGIGGLTSGSGTWGYGGAGAAGIMQVDVFG